MPNKRAHLKLGAVTGGAAALYHARNERPRDVFLEVAGGVAGGMMGGLLPDRLDPPATPNHRDAFHSLALLLLLLVLTLEGQRRACRVRATEIRCRASTGTELAFTSDFWLFACGFFTGVQWGYVSHLAADMTTVAGLPFVCRGL